MKTDRNPGSKPRTNRRTSWISLGFEDLVRTIKQKGSPNDPFDVLIVGSGYGGAVAAAEFAGATRDGQPISVCVLERGQEYLRGAFPSGVDELAGHVRFSNATSPQPAGKLEGLFDLRLGPDVTAIVANGLGGGSLINAGVMLAPEDPVLESMIPPGPDGARANALRELKDYLAKASSAEWLGANRYPDRTEPQKARALHALSPAGQFGSVPITVRMPRRVPGKAGRTTSANVGLQPCVECGDCATGCNFGAKNSLDLNLLVRAAARGASIYTGASVLWLEQGTANAPWIVRAVPTDRTLRTRHGEPLKIHARKLILAAGTFGSTEILLRSRSEDLKFSAQLGRRFSTNGDMIAVVYGQGIVANAIADEGVAPRKREIGPTITSMVDLRRDPARPYAFQEIAVPGALRRIFEETFATSHALHQLPRSDNTTHGLEDGTDPCAVDRAKFARTSVLAIMGDDGARGALELVGERREEQGDGAIRVRWPDLRTGTGGKPNNSLFDKQMKALQGLAGPGATVLPNPLWRLLPEEMSFLIDDERGPVLTVHPLGGCGMGADRTSGVVDFFGRVFDASSQAASGTFGGLVVLDGSIAPRAFGINPALTITALALRATEHLMAHWQFQRGQPAGMARRVRPVFDRAKPYGAKPASTFAIVERLSGNAWIALKGDLLPRKRRVELTIKYEPTALAPLMTDMARTLVLDPSSRLRVYEVDDYRIAAEANPDDYRKRFGRLPPREVETRLDAAKLFEAPLRGKLTFFHREPSLKWERRVSGLWRWVWHRGLRDIVQYRRQHAAEKGSKQETASTSIPGRFKSALALATRAGEVRLFDYDLTARPENRKPIRIRGRKKLSYALPTNLWEQLESMKLLQFGPRMTWGTLAIDLPYFTAQKTPLARIASQHNLASSLVELGGFAAYLSRVLINMHIWTFRRPDTPRPRLPQRLPGEIVRELSFDPPPRPRIYEIDVDKLASGVPVKVRLTRYARFESEKAPVLLIHGYSASGTTFAHTAVRPNLAELLWESGRDVWIVDMRTSCGMPTAVEPWSFEDAALVDIPAAIHRVLQETGRDKLDVVAHCMGAAMLSMAVLKAPEVGDPWFEVREKLPELLRSVVLSQVGPLVKFSPINVLRAYIMRYVRQYLGVSVFDFRVKDSPSLPDQILDRFLASLRYVPEELKIENPLNFLKRTEFAGTRHRIDALFGRAFSLTNLSTEVLDNLDDFFGPLNLETVAQGMYMAQQRVITDRHGRNVYLSRTSRDKRWTFPTFAIHGKDNGLIDVDTQNRLDLYFNRDEVTLEKLAHPRIEQKIFEHCGHQDSFIGRKSGAISRAVIEFLDRDHPVQSHPSPAHNWLVAPPWLGPHRGIEAAANGRLRIAVASNRKHGDAVFAVCVAARRDAQTNRFVVVVPPAGAGMPRTSTYVYPAKCGKDGWLSIEVPQQLLQPSDDDRGLLVLLLHDQFPSMPDTESFITLQARLVEVTAAHMLVPAELNPGNAMLVEGTAQGTLQLLAEDFVAFEIEKKVRQRVHNEMRDRPARDFESAFIPVAKPAGDERLVARIFAGSCQYPSGLLDADPAWKSYGQLGRLLENTRAGAQEKRLLLLVGDQIYSDATAGLFDPSLVFDRYRRPHEALFGRKEVKAVLRRIPAAMMLDDHEIVDNWEPAPDDHRPRESLKDGVAAYKDFQRRAGPELRKALGDAPDPLWFRHSLGEVQIFVADTRTERRARTADRCEFARIMSGRQLGELKEWLSAHRGNPAPKFIACPAMPFPLRLSTHREILEVDAYERARAGSMRSDAWEGFPASLHVLLHHIVAKQVPNVIFLSGDEHLGCDAEVTITQRTGQKLSQTIRAIHCCPLYAPFTFANSRPADFAATERYEFEIRGRRNIEYECVVTRADFSAVRNGFTEIQVYEGQPRPQVIFHDADAVPARPPPALRAAARTAGEAISLPTTASR